jgi:hypothetical protein
VGGSEVGVSAGEMRGVAPPWVVADPPAGQAATARSEWASQRDEIAEDAVEGSDLGAGAQEVGANAGQAVEPVRP